jgi:hypothetical protein
MEKNIVKNKIFNNNFSQTKKIFSVKIVNPKRDWHILLFVFIILIISAIGFDFYIYQKIVGGDMYVTINKDELTIENLKSDDLQKILDYFEIKKSKISTIKLENLVDPSI